MVGITSLGLEHQNLLGNTLEQIAYEKGGIIKPDCMAFTVDTVPVSGLKVLQDCATDANVRLEEVFLAVLGYELN